ncbi:synaptotagmin-10 [Trichonephila clavata]|uniref:Synaptotagmin-10 n=1 Tax=Trichonephila clavata TaxID=2740835 RepID=A0A8X6GYU5_TRICU|nr:synaptotagmin-10 [Trichonephila clavata]
MFNVDDGFASGFSLPPFLAAGLTFSLVLLGIVAYFSYRWLVQRLQSSTKPAVERTDPEQASSSSQPQQQHQKQTDCKLPSIEEKDDSLSVDEGTEAPKSPSGSTTASVKISHSLPDIKEELDVPFEVCNISQRDSQAIGRIRPELYQQDMMRQWSADSGADLLGDGTEQGASCGKLTFTLRYDHDVEGLIVKILQARDLPAKDFSGTSDPYIKLYLLPDRKKKFQTRVHRRNLNPMFNETFVFGVPYEQLRSRTIQFSVYDFDRFSRHDLIGQVLVRGLPELCDISHDVEYTMDILGVPQEKVDLGEVMLSLCYLPTAGRLTVTIIKARNLKVMDITGSSDPYVKVSLMCQGKRVKKKKTSVKKSTLNPVYNEALVFDVPAENIEDVTLVVKVIDYDRVGANEVMGCFAIGSSCIGLGRDHWIEMLDNPRKPVAQWYTLQESLSGLTVDNSTMAKSSPIKCISMR